MLEVILYALATIGAIDLVAYGGKFIWTVCRKGGVIKVPSKIDPSNPVVVKEDGRPYLMIPIPAGQTCKVKVVKAEPPDEKDCFEWRCENGHKIEDEIERLQGECPTCGSRRFKMESAKEADSGSSC